LVFDWTKIQKFKFNPIRKMQNFSHARKEWVERFTKEEQLKILSEEAQ